MSQNSAIGFLTRKVRNVTIRFSYPFRKIKSSGLFDRDFYLRENQDVAESGQDALTHFITSGTREHRDPNPLFETSFFLAQLSSVQPDDGNILLQYLESPKLWQIDPHPLFSIAYYRHINPAVAKANIPPLLYYILHHGDSDADPHPLFDGKFYKYQVPEIVSNKISPLAHYLQIGRYFGKEPFRDVSGTHIDLSHYMAKRRREACPVPMKSEV